MSIISVNPIELGMPFLEREPAELECYHKNQPDTWHSCTKEEICRAHSSGRMNLVYRANKSDPEYLNNWVIKLGLLCETKSRIGLLGSSYFVGIIAFIVFIPALSDRIGRKSIFCATMFASIIA